MIPSAAHGRPPGCGELRGRKGDVLGGDSVGRTADTVGYNGDSSIECERGEEGVLCVLELKSCARLRLNDNAP